MKKNTKIVFGIFAAIILLGATFALRSPSENGSIVIGFMGPLSGQYASAGDNVKKGVELAIDLYQEEHPDRRIVLVAEDDQFNAQKGLSAFKKLTSIDNIHGLVNISTPTLEAISPEINNRPIPTVQLGLQSSPATPDYIFQMTPDDKEMIREYARYLSTYSNFEKLIIVHENTDVHNAWVKPFVENYVPGVADTLVLNTKDDLRSTAARISSLQPDAIVILMNSEIGALFTKELKKSYKREIALLYDAQLQSGWSDYQRILGDTKILDGSLALWLKGGDQDFFRAAYMKKFGTEPGFWADIGYDSLLTLMNAYDRNPSSWKTDIQATDAVGASGGIAFDQNGVRVQPIVINIVREGKIIELK